MNSVRWSRGARYHKPDDVGVSTRRVRSYRKKRATIYDIAQFIWWIQLLASSEAMLLLIIGVRSAGYRAIITIESMANQQNWGLAMS